jgi:hypothetical protein
MSLRRVPITAAIAVLIVVTGLIAGMWLTAWADDRIAAIFRKNYGNHGVWRRHATIGVMYDYVLAYTWLAAMPLTLIGNTLERESGRSLWVSGWILIVILTGCLHFPLFD